MICDRGRRFSGAVWNACRTGTRAVCLWVEELTAQVQTGNRGFVDRRWSRAVEKGAGGRASTPGGGMLIYTQCQLG
jgi:hypothetical protein